MSATTKTDLAQWLARSARVAAREAHARGATGTKVTFAYIEGIVNQMCCDRITDADAWTTWTLRKAHRLAVDGLRETGELHLIDPADVPAKGLTGRQRVEEVMADRGWAWQRRDRPYPNGAVHKLYTRGKGELIEITYTAAGAVRDYKSNSRIGGRWLMYEPTRKAERIIEFLRGA